MLKIDNTLNKKYNPDKIYEVKIDLDEEADKDELASQITRHMREELDNIDNINNE